MIWVVATFVLAGAVLLGISKWLSKQSDDIGNMNSLIPEILGMGSLAMAAALTLLYALWRVFS